MGMCPINVQMVHGQKPYTEWLEWSKQSVWIKNMPLCYMHVTFGVTAMVKTPPSLRFIQRLRNTRKS